MPLLLLFVWIGVLFIFSRIFGCSLKEGFGRRWTTTILIWGAVWVLGIFGTSWWFQGEAWFLVVASVALTLVTLIGAWAEARR